jgi:hypothetical protein
MHGLTKRRCKISTSTHLQHTDLWFRFKYKKNWCRDERYQSSLNSLRQICGLVDHYFNVVKWHLAAIRKSSLSRVVCSVERLLFLYLGVVSVSHCKDVIYQSCPF